MTKGVSSIHKCRNLSDSPGHAAPLLLLLAFVLLGTWAESCLFSLLRVVVMMRNVPEVKANKNHAKLYVGHRSSVHVSFSRSARTSFEVPRSAHA